MRRMSTGIGALPNVTKLDKRRVAVEKRESISGSRLQAQESIPDHHGEK